MSLRSPAAQRVALAARPALSHRERERFAGELTAAGLLEPIRQQIQAFDAAYARRPGARGRPVGIGSSIEMGTLYYSLIRKHRPEIVVETGVCNGLSTAFILQALNDNEKGALYSIDYPEVIGATGPSDHWSQKGGAPPPRAAPAHRLLHP